MKTIHPKPNTFYVKKSVVDDVGISPAYADSYVGVSTNYDIKSNPDTSFYLAENNTVAIDDFIYGEGSIKEIYLSLYTNSLTQSNPQTANWLDVFSVKPNIDIVEGNMSIDSDSYSDTILLYNAYNADGITFIEDFDGINKSFIDLPLSVKKTIGIKNTNILYINLTQLREIAYETDYVYSASPDEKTGWGLSNWVEETKQLGNWMGYRLGNLHSKTVKHLGNLWRSGDETPENFTITLYKTADGTYTVDMDMFREDAPVWMNSGYAKRLEVIKKPRSWWIGKGATEDVDAIMQGGSKLTSYDMFDETFVEPCTQLNSIFSSAYSSPDVRDIKDQTLEGPGDTDRFIAYSYQHLVAAESPSDGRCLRMKAFWENYSGTTSGVVAIDTANPFGRYSSTTTNNLGAWPQIIHSSICGIPQPTPIDITTSGTGFPCYAPEIEVVMKINDMDLTTFATSGGASATKGKFEDGNGTNTLDRSFNIIFNSNAPTTSGNTTLALASLYWVQGGNPSIYPPGKFAPWISFVNEDANSGNVSVYTNQNYFQRGGSASFRNLFISEEVVQGTAPAREGGSIYKTTVPMGEWFTMRIKLNMFNASSSTGPPGGGYINVSGGSSLVYFPDLFDDDGQVKYAVLAHGSPWGENAWGPEGFGGNVAGTLLSGNNAHYPNMTFWVNNMRAINSIPGADVQTDANNRYTKVDAIPNDDKTVDILIDSVNFRNWGPQVTNATICSENGMGLMTKLPAGNFMTPVKYPGGVDTIYKGAISVHPTGTTSPPAIVDNYYAKPSALTASYMSFGFGSSGTIADSTPRDFLFNNFSTGREEIVNPIPNALISGGYFTSGTYLGTFGQNYQNNWFNNLTVGDSTKNINVSGDDNAIDYFTQKGIMAISGAFTNWVKTGNPLIAAKIMNISDDKTTLTVDKPELFDIPLNTPLCVELNNTDYAHKAKGTGSVGYYDTADAAVTIPLVQSRKRSGQFIYLSRPIYTDDAKSPGYNVFNFDYNPVTSKVFTGGSAAAPWWQSNYNLTKATISPYQYWINMAVINASSSAGWGDSFADTTHSGTKMLATRVYDGIVAVSGGSTLGTTFNEVLFNDGIYANRWDINFDDPQNSIINLNTDFGFGVLNTTGDETVPDSDGGLGRMGRDYMLAGQNYINLSSYAYTINPEFRQSFNFLIKPTYMNMFDSLYACNINTGDATTNPLELIYGVKDPLPEVGDFAVFPSVDILKLEDPVNVGNATKAQATDVKFLWKESGEDINYRLMFVDTELIENKYHKSICIIPLNEATTTSPPKFYTSVSNYIQDTGETFLGSNNTPDIEGAQGWGLKLDGTNYIGTSGTTGTPEKRLQLFVPGGGYKFTHCFHLKPSDDGTFFSATGSTLGTPGTGTPLTWQYEISSSKVKMKIGTSGATPTLTSTTSYNLDGVQPLAVVLTFNTVHNSNNFKLYVNGKLEDTLDYDTRIQNTAGGVGWAGVIGANSDYSNKYTGFVEEISFHDIEAYVPPNSNKYSLATNVLDDMTASRVSNKYQARMFLFDYHNIRGTSPTQVCRTNTTSWKVTGVS